MNITCRTCDGHFIGDEDTCQRDDCPHRKMNEETITFQKKEVDVTKQEEPKIVPPKKKNGQLDLFD